MKKALFSLPVKIMIPGGYKIRDQSAIHFVTFSVVEWVNVFTRQEYADIVLDSIRYCQREKGLLLHCWCLMSNHIHLIASASQKDLADVFGTSIDYLMMGDNESKAQASLKDTELINQFKKVNSLPDEEKSIVLKFITAYIRDFNTQKAYAS